MLSKHRLVGVIPHYDLLQKGQNMLGKTICVVAGDHGGFNALLPVLDLALENGCTVHAFLAATCRTQYEAGELTLDTRIHVATGKGTTLNMSNFFSGIHSDLLLVGASQSEEGAMAANNAIENRADKCKIIGVEDMYKSMVPTLCTAGIWFDRVCVIDEHAKEILLTNAWISGRQIVVTGGPQFDKAVEVKKNWAQHRSKIRNLLKAKDDALVFLLAGGVNGSAELLEIVDEGIKLAGIGDRAQVLLRMHPRSTAEDKKLLGQYLADGLRIWFSGRGTEAAANIDDLLPGVDFVLSGFSTVNHLAILYQMPGVVYVGTPAFQNDLMTEKRLHRPPEVDAGAAWYVQNPEEMVRIIRALHLSDFAKSEDAKSITDAQHRIASYNDGHAAQRVWQEMRTLMS